MPENLRRRYENGLAAFMAGKWTEAGNLLASLQGDGPTAALKKYIADRPEGPPPGWDGTIVMASK
jgi:hypothetical protein